MTDRGWVAVPLLSSMAVILVTLSVLLPASPNRGLGGFAEAVDAPGGATDPLRADEIRNIVDPVIRALLEKHGIPGMAVALTFDGKPHLLSYGVTAKEGGVPVTDSTLFEIGSASKPFTATLATYAHETGALSLDDPPSRHLPQLAGHPIGRASLLQLGTYTAGGLPLQFPAEVQAEDQVPDYFRSWEPEAAPGTIRRYSNPSIGLLGHIAGEALGADFAELVESRLLPALGLEASHIRVPEHAMHRYAWGHNAENEQVRVNPGIFDAEAYGLKSTASDMIRFVQANIDPAPFDPPLRRAIEGTQVGHYAADVLVQGLGWEQFPWPIPLEALLAGNAREVLFGITPVTPMDPPRAPDGPTLFNKTGSTGGFGAYVAFVPELSLGIVMLANRNYPIPDRVEAAHAILESLTELQSEGVTTR